MGAVMSMYLAAEHPGQVAGLLMYSTTLKYDGWSINKLAFLTPLLMKSRSACTCAASKKNRPMASRMNACERSSSGR
jgi:hypothetical protein